MTRVLAVASEVFPLVKTGGLADVVGALPAALKPHGIDMVTVVPGYPAVMNALTGTETLLHYDDFFGGSASLVAGKAAGLDLIALDAGHLFGRAGNPYLDPSGKDWPDNWRRFAAFSFAAADLAGGSVPALTPDVVHVHDWPTGLVPAYLRYAGRRQRSLVTIHNLAFQGQFPAWTFAELRLPIETYSINGIEYYGGVGYLKAGLQYADAITTVSPTYAEEICTPEGGMGLDGLLRTRRGVLTGIVNGIDIKTWDPATDPNLIARYTSARLKNRDDNKREIERRLSLATGPGMIVCVISRLTGQKGIDLLGERIDVLVEAGVRFAVLGSGDPVLEDMFRSAAARHPGRVGAVIGYDEPLAHVLQGGADAIVIPSRFEPCGLTQFYGLRYGCIPIVSRVGGLADTVIDSNDAALSAGVATGVQFAPVEAGKVEGAIRRAQALYGDAKTWQTMQKRGMKSDVSWSKSAGRYADLYRGLAAPG